MQRPQSLEFKGVRKDKLTESKPPMISYEPKTSETPTQRLWPVSIISPQQFVKMTPKLSYKIENRCVGRFISLDQQVSQLSRLSNQSQKTITTAKPHSGLPQSQSFTQNMYKSPQMSASMRHPPSRDNNNNNNNSHTSRLIVSTYMTPPPKDWITVGNIIPVKRSISMPGNRPINANLSKSLNQPVSANSNSNPTTSKKKSGPFQCLKHSIKKSTGRHESLSYSIRSNNNPSRFPDKALAMNLSAQFPKENVAKVKVNINIFVMMPGERGNMGIIWRFWSVSDEWH